MFIKTLKYLRYFIYILIGSFGIMYGYGCGKYTKPPIEKYPNQTSPRQQCLDSTPIKNIERCQGLSKKIYTKKVSKEEDSKTKAKAK